MPAPELAALGWNDDRGIEAAERGYGVESAARVIRTDGRWATARGLDGEIRIGAHGLVTGDWVVLDDHGGAIALPRRTAVARRAPGRESRDQILAANVDFVLLVEPLYPGPHERRLERMLALAWSSGAIPLIVLTKSDLGDQSASDRIRSIALGVDVVPVSSISHDGIAELRRLMGPAYSTFVLIGPSGAGKSTLVNTLAGRSVLDVGPVRADGRGRHTTSHRELVPVPGLGILLDTPGLREVGMTGDLGGIDRVFTEIALLAEECRYRDCAHGTEPGCAVRAAVTAGTLAPLRVDNYLRLQREAESHAARREAHDRVDERRDTRGRQAAKRAAMRSKGR